jgi:hypothetical protein
VSISAIALPIEAPTPGIASMALPPALFGDRAEIGLQAANRFGGSAVGGDAKRVGSLRDENVGGLIKLVGDLIVGSN